MSAYQGTTNVAVDHGAKLPICHYRRATLTTSSEPLILNYALEVPELKFNLPFVNQLCYDNNRMVNFEASSMHIKDRT